MSCLLRLPKFVICFDSLCTILTILHTVLLLHYYCLLYLLLTYCLLRSTTVVLYSLSSLFAIILLLFIYLLFARPYYTTQLQYCQYCILLDTTYTAVQSAAAQLVRSTHARRAQSSSNSRSSRYFYSSTVDSSRSRRYE